MAIGWNPKDPNEIYEYDHDWSPRMLVGGVDVGDTILTAGNPDPAKVPTAEIVQGDVAIDAIVAVPGTNRYQYWLSGGTIKSRITATIWTAQGRKYQETFILPIKDR